MLDEHQAIQAAYQAFRETLPDAAFREVTAFTRDNGLTWSVHFCRPMRVEVNEETGIVTEYIESSNSWVLFVDGETGEAYWPEI